MRKYCLIIGIVLLGCVIGGKVYGKSGVFLKYKWVEGRELSYETKSTINSTTEMGEGMTQTSITFLRYKLKRRVDKVSGDTVVITVTYEEAEGTVETGAQTMPIPGLDELNGVKVTLTLRGTKVIDRDISEDLSPQVNAQVEGIISGIERDLDLLSGGGEIKPGGKWDVEYESDGEQTRKHCTVEGFKEMDGLRCAKITCSSQVDIEQEKAQQGMEVKFTGKGKAEGVIYFAIKEGYKVYEKNSASIEGKVEIPAMSRSFNSYTDVAGEVKLIH